MTLGQAINRAMQQSPIRKQTALADALGIDQTAVSKMIRGKVAVTVERVAEIEDLCNLPRGQILVWSGYVSDISLVDELIEDLAPAALTQDKVVDLMAALEASVKEAQAARAAQPVAAKALATQSRTWAARREAAATGTHGTELPMAATSGKARRPAKRPSRRPRPEANE